MATLFSCKVGEVSHEWPQKKHGFFSYYLTRGLLGAAADDSGKVTLNSLETYLAREVSAAVKQQLGRSQTPWLSAHKGRRHGPYYLRTMAPVDSRVALVPVNVEVEVLGVDFLIGAVCANLFNRLVEHLA